MANLLRLVPERPLPPYTYVPGQSPHPLSDPAGHSFKRPVEKPAALDPERWHESRDYLFGFDLFNHGYAWEAHETWEGLWHACGRRGLVADLLKGLIKLAAAVVKLRQGTSAGVLSHVARARVLFDSITDRLPSPTSRFLGLALRDLTALADEIVAVTEPGSEARATGPFPFPLPPQLTLLPKLPEQG